MADDIKERLLETRPQFSETTGGHLYDVFWNRDGVEAAARIAELEGENERLREALRKVDDWGSRSFCMTCNDTANKARAALNQEAGRG